MEQLLKLEFVLVTVLCGTFFSCHSLPIRVEQVDGKSVGASSLLPFLKRFGYLESGNSNNSTTDHESDALYTQESIEEAILEMQRFGDIPQTGQLDEATLKLLTTPRCGLPDVFREEQGGARKKRFVIGANGWNKRRLTYRVENWAPELDESSVSSELRRAFGAWADYSRLRFVSKPRWNYDDVDISISFGRGHHGDRYPFDGNGGVLAHAFFPYGHGSLGGDIHFDMDEKWRSSGNSSGDKGDGSEVSFFAVAVHEIGHSLGLGHSPSRDSVMFPYYQYDDQGESAMFRLGYDDIMAMYQLYIQRYIEDFPDDESHSSSTTTTTTTTEAPSTTSTKRYTYYPEYTTPPSIPTSTSRYDYPTPTATTSFTTETSTRSSSSGSTTDGYYSSTERSSSYGTDPSTSVPTRDYGHYTSTTVSPRDENVPDLCTDGYDTISYLRNEIFVFKSQYMWRFRKMGMKERGYPVKTERLFPMLREVPRIDAAFENGDGKIHFFSGNKYWTFYENGEGSQRPSSIRDFSLPPELHKIDAAFIWGKNKKTYFFSGNLFWRWNETMRVMDEGYPKGIERWRGLPADGIDSVMKWSDGRTYFFKKNEFWRFDDTLVETDEGFPLPTSSFWFGC